MALFSGGLDSVLAVKWMQQLGYKVYPVFFRAPYLPSARAEKTALDNGLELIVRDISTEHLLMMQNPVHGFGKHFNPCIDCHGLMFRIAGLMLKELKADFLISGEVLGQRPMSQHRKALGDVEKLSGVGDLIVRPLCQQLLPNTKPIREAWVNKADLLAFNGRTRTPQIELAKQLNVSFPSPGGGCLLTDRNYTLRLRELIAHQQYSAENIRLLRWGRHFRLSDEIKLIVGRTQADNEGLEQENFPGLYLKQRDLEGPLGLITHSSPPLELISLAASILLSYSRKAPSPGYVKYGIDNIYDREILVAKCPETVLNTYKISLD